MMWPEPELRAIIRPEPEPEMKNRSLHSTSLNYLKKISFEVVQT
jgi:hypothetical protein